MIDVVILFICVCCCWLCVFVFGVFMLVVLFGIVVFWLLGMSVGLCFVLVCVVSVIGGVLQVVQVEGCLVGLLMLCDVCYCDGSGFDVCVVQVWFDLVVWLLLCWQLYVFDLQVDGISVMLVLLFLVIVNDNLFSLQLLLDIVFDCVCVGCVCIIQFGNVQFVFVVDGFDLVGVWIYVGLCLYQFDLCSFDGWV